MKRNQLFAWVLSASLVVGVLTSCQQDESAEMIDQSNLKVQKEKELKVSSLMSNSDFQSLISKDAKFVEFIKRLENGENISKDVVNYLSKKKGLNDAQAGDLTRYYDYLFQAINPGDYNCVLEEDPFSDYLNSTLQGWTYNDLLLALYIAGDYPLYDAIFFQPDGDRQEYGIDGEHTNAINRTFKDLKRFFDDMYSEDILLVAMKGGEVLNDVERIKDITKVMYPGDTDAEAMSYAELVQRVFTQDKYWNGDHPIFSLNAFALSGFLQDRIAMGDGILKVYQEIGLGDVAPQAILAHEFAHHIQYEKGYFDDANVPATKPEATRRTELMADAFAAYYLTHKKGATMNWKRVQQFMEVFTLIGDCSFTSDGHHGTHQQRLAAAKWGYELASNAKVQGEVLSIDELYELFQNDLNKLINCDTCLN